MMRAALIIVGWLIALFLLAYVLDQADARGKRGGGGPNVVKGTKHHDWSNKPGRMNPACGAPLKCVGDLKGSNRVDVFRGSPGFDWLNSGSSSDRLFGGGDMDQLYGGDAKDKLIGQSGHDHLFGDQGNDYMDASDGMNEPGNVEEMHGDRPHKGQRPGFDTCVIDADPDGAVVHECEVLHIEPIAGYSGKTRIFMSVQAKNANNYHALLSPGTHYNLP
jgi:hypothetical protein